MMYVLLPGLEMQLENIQTLDCQLLIWVDSNMKNYMD